MIKFFTKGFSHGDGYVCKALGLPVGFKVDKEEISHQLALRRQGIGRSQRMTAEKDEIVFLSGLDSFGKTDGTPLQFFIKNSDNTLQNKPSITALRSGHADLVGCTKLKLKDARRVCELSSARRTVAYTAFGAICKQILKEYGIYTYSYLRQVGKVISDEPFDFFSDAQLLDEPLRCKNKEVAKRMEHTIFKARESGDSIGGKVVVGCVGLPMGVGDFVNYENKLDAIIAKTMMSIPSVKAVEFGLGVDYASLTNTQVADKLICDGDNVNYSTNNCGGIVAGLTTNMPLNITLTVKPVPTSKKSVETIDIQTKEKVFSHYERSDTCVVQNVGIIAENMLAISVLDAYMAYANTNVLYKKFNKNDFSDKTVFVVDKILLDKCNFDHKDKVIIIENPEEEKNINSAIRLLQYLASQNLSKTDLVVAIGGGALIDLCGFVASIFKRGIRFWAVPTTLLSMVDAGHGGKNAVNFQDVKNMIGTFGFPQCVLIDFEFLQTNTPQMFEEGFGEIVKCALLDFSLRQLLEERPNDYEKLIKECVRFKNEVVHTDTYDDFWRCQLNAGHTFGHSFEIFYNLPHGQAVLMGLIWECKLARYLNKITEEFYGETMAFLMRFADSQICRKITQKEIKPIIELCLQDKKNSGDKITFVFVLPYHDFSVCTLTSAQIEEFFSNV